MFLPHRIQLHLSASIFTHILLYSTTNLIFNASHNRHLLVHACDACSLTTFAYLLHGAGSFLKANWFAASQEIPCVLWNPKVPHRTHKRPLPVPILSQPNPVLTPTSQFLNIHSNIILPSTTGSPQRSLSLRFPHQNPVHTSPFPHTCYMPRPSHSS
jgi:hypothetical protein